MKMAAINYDGDSLHDDDVDGWCDIMIMMKMITMRVWPSISSSIESASTVGGESHIGQVEEGPEDLHCYHHHRNHHPHCHSDDHHHHLCTGSGLGSLAITNFNDHNLNDHHQRFHHHHNFQWYHQQCRTLPSPMTPISPRGQSSILSLNRIVPWWSWSWWSCWRGEGGGWSSASSQWRGILWLAHIIHIFIN